MSSLGTRPHSKMPTVIYQNPYSRKIVRSPDHNMFSQLHIQVCHDNFLPYHQWLHCWRLEHQVQHSSRSNVHSQWLPVANTGNCQLFSHLFSESEHNTLIMEFICCKKHAVVCVDMKYVYLLAKCIPSLAYTYWLQVHRYFLSRLLYCMYPKTILRYHSLQHSIQLSLCWLTFSFH